LSGDSFYASNGSFDYDHDEEGTRNRQRVRTTPKERSEMINKVNEKNSLSEDESRITSTVSLHGVISNNRKNRYAVETAELMAQLVNKETTALRASIPVAIGTLQKEQDRKFLQLTTHTCRSKSNNAIRRRNSLSIQQNRDTNSTKPRQQRRNSISNDNRSSECINQKMGRHLSFTTPWNPATLSKNLEMDFKNSLVTRQSVEQGDESHSCPSLALIDPKGDDFWQYDSKEDENWKFDSVPEVVDACGIEPNLKEERIPFSTKVLEDQSTDALSVDSKNTAAQSSGDVLVDSKNTASQSAHKITFEEISPVPSRLPTPDPMNNESEETDGSMSLHFNSVNMRSSRERQLTDTSSTMMFSHANTEYDGTLSFKKKDKKIHVFATKVTKILRQQEICCS
jgi:hypothetical protein